MNCLECGTRMIKNGTRELKYRGVIQNFYVGVVVQKNKALALEIKSKMLKYY
ncbi:MAG: hypothetical protein NT129_01370 [Candidatus Aenigmarchaeota archaeon]|nr:hypothetical protein [Candidatus Aenigmarchaeota archaeon]